jgi:hypothetical protein
LTALGLGHSLGKGKGQAVNLVSPVYMIFPKKEFGKNEL